MALQAWKSKYPASASADQLEEFEQIKPRHA
jgi:hypothetical protein